MALRAVKEMILRMKTSKTTRNVALGSYLAYLAYLSFCPPKPNFTVIYELVSYIPSSKFKLIGT